MISFLIGAGLFVWIGKIVGWQGIKNAFLVFTGWQGLVILGLTILMAIVGTWKWKVILKNWGINVSLRSLFQPYLAGFSVMFLAPPLVFGGEIFRSYVLKERNAVPWLKGMASVVIDRVLEWTTNLVVIFFGLLFFLSKIGLPPQNLGIIFGTALLIFLIVISYFYFKTFRRESIMKSFLNISNGKVVEIEKEIFSFFKPKNKIMWQGIGLSFLRGGIMLVRVWILVLFLVGNGGFLPSLSILGFHYLAAMLPIPTALGSHEAIQAFSFNALGWGANVGTAFTMIIRAAELIVALAGIILLFRLGMGFFKKILLKDTEKLIMNNDKNIQKDEVQN